MKLYTHRYNGLSTEQRKHLIPYLIESQILDYEVVKLKAIKAHQKFLKDVNSHIANLQKELDKESK